MTDPTQYPESDPRHHAVELRRMINEVCGGLATAFEHYEKQEPAWPR